MATEPDRYPAVDAFDVLVLAAEQGTLIATRPDRRKAALRFYCAQDIAH
jgi:hypothetical protein